MDSVERLEKVLALLEQKKLKVAGLVVGDVRIHFAEPTGTTALAPKRQTPEQKELAGMRERYRNLFGRDPPSDEALQELKGVL